jgi:ATP diphosphatase
VAGGGDSTLPGVRRLLEVMRRLRDPESGCPWDRAQDSRSLARYTLEEACEVIAAIESGDGDALREELGDLLFQVVFHAELARERGDYDFDAVADAIAGKLERRHPHVFGGAPGRDARHWEELKAEERAARGARGVLADIPLTLPALARAAKLGRRAAQVGFDWPDADGARAKVLEELEEIEAARRGEGTSSLEDEVGDLLLAVTSFARHLGVEPETALRRANRRFEERFAALEALARRRGLDPARLDAATLDALWNDVKKGIQS